MAFDSQTHALVTQRTREARNIAPEANVTRGIHLPIVLRQTKTARTTGAAVRRAANRQRVAGAVVLAASDQAGNAYTLVLCTKEPGRAYLLTREKTQEWRCSCFRARRQATCDHLEAIKLLEAAEVADA